jgi:hypothetical protein
MSCECLRKPVFAARFGTLLSNQHESWPAEHKNPLQFVSDLLKEIENENSSSKNPV